MTKRPGLHANHGRSSPCSDVIQSQIRRESNGRRSINRNRFEGYTSLYNDYFAEQPIYPDRLFRRRFRMRRPLFLRLTKSITEHDSYFVQKRNAAEILRFAPIQKIAAAIRMLAYGVAPDAIEDCLRMAETTILLCLRRFCAAMMEVFGEEYLRYPNESDVEKLLAMGVARGFPGMLGSLNCTHWAWKNCPTAWHGQYTGKEKEPTIILEAVASYDTWIWHAFFGTPGSCYDLNVLDR